jgi:DNA-binding beta-propeller fold protein YncE
MKRVGQSWRVVTATVAGLLWLGCSDPRLEHVPRYDDREQPAPRQREPGPRPILRENEQPGAPDWLSGRRSNSGQVEVYTSLESVELGDTLGIKVSTDVPATVTAEVFRVGHYGGAGARRVWSGGPWHVRRQAPCERDPVTSRVECDWQDTFSLQVPEDWVSGLYVVKLQRHDRYMRLAPFVVRDWRAADILYTPNFTTYQAYNTWGGESLYFNGSRTMPRGRAWEVSFDRPYQAADGAGKTFLLDVALVQLLEREGYDVTYGTQLDFVRFPRFLQRIGALVYGGQDEYWPVEERDQVDEALAGGNMSLAYFGANGAYWRIRLVPDRYGHPLRTIACYKGEPESDPIPYSTVRYRDPPDARSENSLFGVMYENWQLIPFPLVVADSSHWLFEGTGLAQGELLPGLVGYEYDKAFPDHPGYPQGVRTSMISPVVGAEGVPSSASTVDRTLPSGRLVFAAGTIWWALGLDRSGEAYDPRVERMTLNVLERALAHRSPPRVLPAPSGPPPERPEPQAAWARSVGDFAGLPGAPGHVDGPAAQARFSGPTGLAFTPQGELVVADTAGNRIRMVLTDEARTVVTLAGTGALGERDGEGSQAMFRWPTGVAVGPQGELYVADSDNHSIRRLRQVGNTWQVDTVAGTRSRAGFEDGPAHLARFNRPTALAVDGEGNLYVADQANSRIRRVRAGTHEVETLAGSGAFGSVDAAVGAEASFNNPTALALGPEGMLYVVDAGNHLIRRVETGGSHAVSTMAGSAGLPGFADGPGTQARFRAQFGLAFGPLGELLIADSGNYRLRKLLPGVDAASTQVYTLAGSGRFGLRSGHGSEAELVAPAGLAEGPEGRLYVSDSFHHVIRVIER